MLKAATAHMLGECVPQLSQKGCPPEVSTTTPPPLPNHPCPSHTESTVHTHLPALAEEDKEYNNNDHEQTNDHQSCNDNTRNDATVVRFRRGGCGGICGRK